ncbi:uncharacterized protein BX663DRAFT_458515 [Cokeromyces recurvatus]|uniref:uncharacterized protein n=1 Tax=Cokeromyces recurvatus TaxID=90255 RepID=UPI00221FC68A|nr:uncharacterized protein BX663DRAFT_458515 [Cokeromyces recurvatus]KAI7900385.1 hypothetical protein BX663DRAFT_458515 [Cokeromyces recurvatus]
MPSHCSFQSSFWSPTASIDPMPNFNMGFNVLHTKLQQSMTENKVIIEYMKQRITTERNHASTLVSLSILNESNPFENDIGASLKKCFEIIRTESAECGEEYRQLADHIETKALEPLLKFTEQYESIILQSKETVEKQLNQFNVAWKTMEGAKTMYQNKCKLILNHFPDFKFENNDTTKIQIGSLLQFDTRDYAWNWFDTLVGSEKNRVYSKDQILNILKNDMKEEEELEVVLKNLMEIRFLIKSDNEDMYYKGEKPDELEERNSTSTSSSHSSTSNNNGRFSGFLSRWGNQESKRENLMIEMLEADKAYRKTITQAEKIRTQTEQILLIHYEEMEALEFERIKSIKQAFISMSQFMSHSIMHSKERVDAMMLYQETLRPDKDVQFIVEQYRTGQFCPRTILYENYFTGITEDQLFGVPLEEVTRVQNSLVPQLISQGITLIELGFSKLYDEEKSVVWTANLPLDRVYAARDEINISSKKLLTIDMLKKFDLLLLASLVRLYLLELPQCLFTFELYEPCKLIYSNHQDQNSRLASISKLLATLPTSNYHTVMLLFQHFHKLIQEIKTDTQQCTISIAKTFSYILLRPQIETNISLHERYSQRLLQDLIENYDLIFTQESYKAQEKNSTRPSIIMSEPILTNPDNEQKSVTENTVKKRAHHNVDKPSSPSLFTSFMRKSQSTPTSSPASSIKRQHSTSNSSITMMTGGGLIMPMPSSSTLFEDPDEIMNFNSSESSSTICVKTPSFQDISSRKSSIDPLNYNNRHSIEDTFMIEELASLDSFFEDED